jgi:hypothetical protein
MARIPVQQAYPEILFRWRSANWLSRLIGLTAECEHLESHSPWMATFLPDNLYLQGKNVKLREPHRAEVSLCRDCFAKVFERELAAFGGRVAAFEPDAESVTQYFFVAAPDFEAAGVEPAVARVIQTRLAEADGSKGCRECEDPARWLWFSRASVPHLDAVDKISAASGEWYCAEHGARKLCSGLASLEQANFYYINAPYGEAGAYLWF